jgi:tripartite-type tricarboxylate transporter receptor subunit TctC
LRTALEDPELISKFATFGSYLRYMPPEEVTAFTQSEQKTWRPIMEQIAREAQ